MTGLLTTNQVHDLLKVDRTTIYRMVDDGRLPGIRVGKQWRFQQTEIEQWLRRRTLPGDTPLNIQQSSLASQTAQQTDLRSALPLACVQLIQDAFGDMLEATLLVTDIQAQPITQPSNVCGLYKLLMRQTDLSSVIVGSYQHLADRTSLEPRFFTNEVGLLCVRAVIHLEQVIAGMVVISGIAPVLWPPNAEYATHLAATFQVKPGEISTHLHEVHHLDKRDQDRVLRCVQRIADIFSHIAKDRNVICGKLQAIASLTTLDSGMAN